jgi:lactoylglutathione lyase
MLPIRGLYEVAIPVRQIQRAETFYRDVLGLEVGLRDDRRNWVFLRAGGAAGVVVLQERDAEFPSCHFAFTVSPTDLERAVTILREHGVPARGGW